MRNVAPTQCLAHTRNFINVHFPPFLSFLKGVEDYTRVPKTTPSFDDLLGGPRIQHVPYSQLRFTAEAKSAKGNGAWGEVRETRRPYPGESHRTL